MFRYCKPITCNKESPVCSVEVTDQHGSVNLSLTTKNAVKIFSKEKKNRNLVSGINLDILDK